MPNVGAGEIHSIFNHQHGSTNTMSLILTSSSTYKLFYPGNVMFFISIIGYFRIAVGNNLTRQI